MISDENLLSNHVGEQQIETEHISGHEELPFDEEHDKRFKKYCEECFKYLTPPIKLLKKCLGGDPELNLKNYAPGNLGVYLLCETLCRPPIPPLKRLDLSNSSFDKIGCIALSDLMQQSLHLEYLNISNCGIGLKGVEVLADGMLLSHSILYVNLSKCELGDSGGAVVFRAIANNKVCQHLDVSYNNLHTATAETISGFLKINQTLKTLNLNWNKLYPEKEGIVKIFKALKDNKAVESLDLSWNGLCGALFANSLRSALQTNQTLKVLRLENNLMGDKELPALCVAIKKSNSLKEVYVGGNKWYERELYELIRVLEINRNIQLFSIGTYTYLEEDSFNLATKIMNENPSIAIIFKGKIKPIPPKEVNFKHILLDRAKFKAMSSQKIEKRRDFGHLMLQLQEVESEYMKREETKEIIQNFGAKLDKDLVNQILDEFTEEIPIGNKMRKVKRISIKKLAGVYLDRHPTNSPLPREPKKPKGRKTKK